MTQEHQTANGILRRKRVEAETGYSRTQIYLLMQRGMFPRQVRLGVRTVGWPASEIAAVNAARIAGKSEDVIRALVRSLHAARGGLQ